MDPLTVSLLAAAASGGAQALSGAAQGAANEEVARQDRRRQREQDLIEHCQAQLQQAVERFERIGEPDPDQVFEHLYQRWPTPLAEQREQMRERVARRGGQAHE